MNKKSAFIVGRPLRKKMAKNVINSSTNVTHAGVNLQAGIVCRAQNFGKNIAEINKPIVSLPKNIL